MTRKIETFSLMLKGTAAFFGVVGLLLAVSPTVLFGEQVAETTFSIRCWGLGMLVYGLGVLLASSNAARNWLVLFVGLLSTLLVSLATFIALLTGTIDRSSGVLVLAISLIGLIPLALSVWHVIREPAGGLAPVALPDDLNLETFRTQDGRSLEALSSEHPVLLVLLRHLGCTFCRETLADVAAQRHAIEEAGARIVFVHMGEDEKTSYLFERYRLEDIPRISDPSALLYHTLGLRRASLLEVYGPAMWRYAVQSILLDGHGMGKIVGDRFQMPGSFLLHKGNVIGGFRHQRISDHPDYLSIIRCAAHSEEVAY